MATLNSIPQLSRQSPCPLRDVQPHSSRGPGTLKNQPSGILSVRLLNEITNRCPYLVRPFASTDPSIATLCGPLDPATREYAKIPSAGFTTTV
jgi:hypothetical protein